MNRVKVSIGILLIFILGALAGSLGTGLYIKHRIGEFTKGGPPPVLHLLMKKMSHQLDLTKEQEAKIEKIMEQTHRDISAFRERYHPEFEKIMDESFALIKETLDEEQKTKLDEFQEELKKRRGRMGPPGMHRKHLSRKSPEHLLAAMKEHLELSEEQAAKVGPIIHESVKRRREVIQRQREEGFAMGGSMRNELRAIREDTEKQLEAVLTVKQMEEFRYIQKKRRRKMFPEMPGLN